MNGCVYRTKDNICEYWSDRGKNIISYCDTTECDERKPTNADRIRAMTDEELAKWLVWHANPEIICEYEDFEIGNYTREYADALDWLKQEAK